MLIEVIDDRRRQVELGRVRPRAFRFLRQELVDRVPTFPTNQAAWAKPAPMTTTW